MRSASISVYHPSAEVFHLAVLVGNQTFNLIVDTGSSNTWVGAGTKYVPSPSSTRTNSSVGVSYGSGSFKGQEYTDMVSLPRVFPLLRQPYNANVGYPRRPDCNKTIYWCRNVQHRFQWGRRVCTNLPEGLYFTLPPRY